MLVEGCVCEKAAVDASDIRIAVQPRVISFIKFTSRAFAQKIMYSKTPLQMLTTQGKV